MSFFYVRKSFQSVLIDDLCLLGDACLDPIEEAIGLALGPWCLARAGITSMRG